RSERDRRTEVGEVAAHESSVWWRSGVARAAEPCEDLPADRVVPVAEACAHRARVRGPRAAAQHLVLRAPEHLGVLAVGKRTKAGVRGEVGGGPLPDVAEQLVRTPAADAFRMRPDRVG